MAERKITITEGEFINKSRCIRYNDRAESSKDINF